MLNFDPSVTQSLPMGSSSDDVLANLQQVYGAVRYSDQQMTRYPYYSYIPYPAAGGSLGFFGTNMGQSTDQLTNVEQAGSLGNNSFLLSAIGFDFFLYTPTVANNQPNVYTNDASALYSDIVHGFTQGGYFELTIGNTKWSEIPLPFMFAPSSLAGRPRVQTSSGQFAFAQAGMTPFAVTGSQASLCYADISRRSTRKMNLKNPIFIAPQQNFQATINYDAGPIPLIATGIVTGGAVLYVGIHFDGWKFAPVS